MNGGALLPCGTMPSRTLAKTVKRGAVHERVECPLPCVMKLKEALQEL